MSNKRMMKMMEVTNDGNKNWNYEPVMHDETSWTHEIYESADNDEQYENKKCCTYGHDVHDEHAANEKLMKMINLLRMLKNTEQPKMRNMRCLKMNTDHIYII